jgi:hemerythrin-like domain-containing protein
MPVTIGAKRESDFTDPLGMLSDCHRRVERFLQALIDITNRVKGESLNTEQKAAFANGLRYFQEAAPKHTADEEESLFPRLRAAGRPDTEQLMERIDALESDHGSAAPAHQEVDRLGRKWLQDGRLAAADAAELSAKLGSLAELYRQHIHMEDHEVFPAASKILTDDDRKAIGEEMAARRGVRRE